MGGRILPALFRTGLPGALALLSTRTSAGGCGRFSPRSTFFPGSCESL